MDIVTLAERVAREVLETVPDLAALGPMDRGRPIADALSYGERGSGPELIATFEDDASFGELRGGWIVQPGQFRMNIQPHMFPHFLIDSIIGGKPAGTLVEEARAFAVSRSSASTFYAPIAGVTVTEPINIGDAVALVPWIDVPEVRQKKFFGPNGGAYALVPYALPGMLSRASANLAVRGSLPECQVLFSSNEEAARAFETGVAPGNRLAIPIRDIVRCLTIGSERAVAALGDWIQFDNPIANCLVGSGYSYSNAMFDNAVYVSSLDPSKLDSAPISRLLRCYKAFNDADRDALNISVDRFNQALRRPDMVDRAIDLGIALEVMLLHGIGAKDRGEMRYRSSIRGAMFLGGEKPDRLITFRLLKEAYDLRSAAVHTGKLNAKQNQSSPTETLEEVSKIYACVVRKLIERGSFPNWDDDYVIGEK